MYPCSNIQCIHAMIFSIFMKFRGSLKGGVDRGGFWESGPPTSPLIREIGVRGPALYIVLQSTPIVYYRLLNHGGIMQFIFSQKQ